MRWMPVSFRGRWAVCSVLVVVLGSLAALIIGLALGRRGWALLAGNGLIGFAINVVFAVVMGWSMAAFLESADKKSGREDDHPRRGPD